ncbi:CD1871A family CXXC motif-containing protein [Ruminococcus callidus]
MVFKKATVQVMLLLAGIAMLIFGIWREEAQTVFSKAIRLCMECVGIG